MDTVNKIQTLSPRSRRLGVVAAAVLSIAACMPAANSHHPFPGGSLSFADSASAVRHRLLSYLDADFGLAGSANAVEHRALSHVEVAGSANASEHRLLSYLASDLATTGSADGQRNRRR